MRRRSVPSGLPVLSRGRHLWPQRGACLMEYVSVLAGERWSDHPKCVDPALAAIARAVNDMVSDAARQPLARLAPLFIGTANVDPVVRTAVVRDVLRAGLGCATDDDERFLLCIGILGLHRYGYSGLHDVTADLGDVDARIRACAAAFVARSPVRRENYLKRGVPAAVAHAAVVIGEHADRRDDILVSLLRRALVGYRDEVERAGATDRDGGMPRRERVGVADRAAWAVG